MSAVPQPPVWFRFLSCLFLVFPCCSNPRFGFVRYSSITQLDASIDSESLVLSQELKSISNSPTHNGKSHSQSRSKADPSNPSERSYLVTSGIPSDSEDEELLFQHDFNMDAFSEEEDLELDLEEIEKRIENDLKRGLEKEREKERARDRESVTGRSAGQNQRNSIETRRTEEKQRENQNHEQTEELNFSMSDVSFTHSAAPARASASSLTGSPSIRAAVPPLQPPPENIKPERDESELELNGTTNHGDGDDSPLQLADSPLSSVMSGELAEPRDEPEKSDRESLIRRDDNNTGNQDHPQRSSALLNSSRDREGSGSGSGSLRGLI
jgi:hypothetical protein